MPETQNGPKNATTEPVPPQAPEGGQEEAPPPQQQPPSARKSWSGRATAAARAVWAFVSVPALISAVIAVGLLHFFDVITLPYFPGSTTGAIYVDSPEVYTRERLVNDRYDQDHWLRERLEDLNRAENLLSGHLFQHASVGRTNDDIIEKPAAPMQQPAPMQNPPTSQSQSAGKDTAKTKTPKASVRPGVLPFDQEFRVRSAIRDTIRQLILENMLDDRHDLTGNSVYGLKFDTTVVPGTHTRRRAFVRIRLTAPEPFTPGLTEPETVGPDNVVPKFFAEYYRRTKGRDWNILYGGSAALEEPYKRYHDWLQNIDVRLNQTWLEAFDNSNNQCEPTSSEENKDIDRPGEEFARKYVNDLTNQTIDIVLGVPGNRVKILEQLKPMRVSLGVGKNWLAIDAIELPEPWSRYMRITRERYTRKDGSYGCSDKPLFHVFQVIENVNIFDVQDDSLPVWASEKGHVPWHGVGNKLFSYRASTTLSIVNFESRIPKYVPSTQEFNYILAQDNLRKTCDFGNILSAKCKNKIYNYAILPSGLFNFIQDVASTDAYSYAIFPRNDVVAVMSDSTLDAAVPRDDGTGNWFRFVQALRKSESRSVLVGFGDSSAGATHKTKGGSGLPQSTVEFGWVISARGDMEPVHKAQMALVSVPVWADSLDLKVTVGWLDRESGEHVRQGPYDVRVPLPVQIEAFDSLLRGRKFPRQPKIRRDLLDSGVVVDACRRARILIPGVRLWRSASVTLGAQRADRISVLPNMKGIIATFNEVEIPHSAEESSGNDTKCSTRKRGETDDWSIYVPLRVWTSEGMDRAPEDVCIRVRKSDWQECSKKCCIANVAASK